MVKATSPTFDQGLHDIIGPSLEPGETMVWAGRPRQGVVFRRRDAITVAVVALFALTYLAVLGRSVLAGPSTAELAFHLLFLAFVVYFGAVSFFVDSFYRSRLFYAVTDRRAILLETMIVREVKSVMRSDFFLARLSDCGDGRGTIRLDSPTQAVNSMLLGMGRTHAALGHPPMFFEIEDAQAVYDLITVAD